jgi:hypothetical protein
MSARRSRTMLRKTPGSGQFIVCCIRQDGRERAWNSYTTQAEAEQVAQHLNRIGCASRVVADGGGVEDHHHHAPPLPDRGAK